MAHKVTKAKQIADFIRNNPAKRNKDIAKLFDTSPDYVSNVRAQWGLPRILRTTTMEIASGVAQTIRTPLMNDPKLCVWLQDQCPDGATLGEFVVSIIRDAYHDEV